MWEKSIPSGTRVDSKQAAGTARRRHVSFGTASNQRMVRGMPVACGRARARWGTGGVGWGGVHPPLGTGDVSGVRGQR